ncbi:hypothetical protein BKA62DRAFT_708102 [Auriculariales sp. MPI-PUGE-AT-0066]|nr:hypothetical protein BKA62DRAFT_708102 [Auriculariales sp. MPI-PUGE-AT-0066]
MAPRAVLLTLLALTAAFGVVGGSLGINALASTSFKDKDKVQAFKPKGTTVDINTNNIIASGSVQTVGCGLLALAAFLSLLLHAFAPHRANARPKLQGGLIGFFSLWVLVTSIATLVIARNGSATVSAFLGSVKVPDSIVKALEKANHSSRVYWDHDYLHSATIVPFIAFFFGLLSTIVLLTMRPSNTATPVVADHPRDEKRHSAEHSSV